MKGKIFISLILIVIGLWIWLSNMGILNFSRDWPFILILVGIYLLFKGESRRKTTKNVREILTRLEKGEISAKDALEKLKED